MADTNLTEEQARALLEKLACDDAFRALFETAPARALHLLGISAETIISLPPACLCCCKKLAPKELYGELLGSCADVVINGAMKFFIPVIGFKENQA